MNSPFTLVMVSDTVTSRELLIEELLDANARSIDRGQSTPTPTPTQDPS